jgi:tRNA(Ile)-lysidine synthase
MQRATIREAIHRLRASLRNINWEHVERAVWLARDGGTGQRATLAAGLELEIGYRTLRIGPEATPASSLNRASLFRPGNLPQGGASGRAASPVPQIVTPLLLVAPDETAIGGGWRIAVLSGYVDALPEDRGARADPWVAFLDADALGSGVMLRPRQPGDRFQPQGLSGHSTKLNEFMINAKVPKDARAGWPLLCGAAGIAWVCGLRVAEWAIVRPETRAVWVVQFISPVESEGSRD